jgi:hypothetical protein
MVEKSGFEMFTVEKSRVERCGVEAWVSISSGQRKLMKTYHNEGNTGKITKIALKFFLDFFGQSR